MFTFAESYQEYRDRTGKSIAAEWRENARAAHGEIKHLFSPLRLSPGGTWYREREKDHMSIISSTMGRDQ